MWDQLISSAAAHGSRVTLKPPGTSDATPTHSVTSEGRTFSLSASVKDIFKRLIEFIQRRFGDQTDPRVQKLCFRIKKYEQHYNKCAVQIFTTIFNIQCLKWRLSWQQRHSPDEPHKIASLQNQLKECEALFKSLPKKMMSIEGNVQILRGLVNHGDQSQAEKIMACLEKGDYS